MSAWAQFSGQLVRTVQLKQRRFGRLVGELALPVLLFCALAALKGISEIENVEAQSYANEAYQVPELDDFLTFEPLDNPYVLLNFGNLAKLESTIGWNCDLNPDNAGSGFFSICENILFAIVPEDGDDAAASAASRELKDYIINSSNNPEAMAAKFAPDDLFSDATELVTYVESPQYGTSSSKPRLGLAIVMNSPTSYTIRTNTTIRMIDGPPPDENELDDLQRGRTTPNEDFRAFGLLSAQMAVDRFIIARETGRAVTLKASHFPMPTSAFKQDEFWTVDDTVQLFGMLAVLYPTAAVIMFLVEDKSSKVRELMFTMGLRPAAYQLAWLLVYGIIFSVLAIVVAVISSESIFVETDTSVLIVFMWLFFMDVLAFAFLISSIFSRTTIAVVVGLMVTFLCNTIYSSLNNESATSELRSVYSLLHPILGFSFGVVAFAKYEVGLVGVTWDNYNLSENDELTVQQAMRNLVIAVVWHLLAAAYIDSLSRHKWHWPVTQWLRNTSSGQNQYAADVDAVEEVSRDPTNRFEPVPAALKELRSQGRCVLIHNATKDFKTSKGVVHALRGLSVDMFEGQITVLLGPNGAGKSTTSSIITGVINPTSGHAYVNGQKCETNLADVRKSLGICPQHNILDTLLTVNENLQVVASIKGMPKGKVMRRINELLGELGLLPKASTAVKNLSGGMKRKLQLAMALFDSTVVILDEPTSGMDTFARQAAQRTIMKHREGRTIILTTHYMDEADMLGDRIAIVADGRLACCGTSLYLKKQYGVGYLLSFEQRSEEHGARETIMESVRSFVPEMEVLSNVGSELVLRLPLSASPSFAGMLRTIEARKEELGIDELGISVTTLDSVFQSATKGLEPLVPEAVKEDDGALLMDMPKKSTADPTANSPLPQAVATETVSGISLVKTLVQKRVLTSSRDRRAWCCQILIPVVFLILGFTSSMNFSNQVQPAVLDLTDSLGVWNKALGVSPVPYGAPAANDVMEYLSFPNLDNSHEVAITPTGSFCIESDELFRRIQLSAVLLVAFEPELENQQDALLAQVLRTAPICDASSGFNGSTLALSDYLQDTRLSLEASRYAGLLVQNVEQDDSELSGEYTIAYNFTARRSSSGLLSRTNAALLRLWTGNAELDIKASLQPLPLTFEESKFVSAIAGFPVVLMFGTAFSFFAAQFAVFMVHEKETKAWHQQLINGVSPRSYWVSNYLFDLCSLFIPLVVSLALLYAFDVTVFIEEIGAVVLIFVLFALAVTPFTYCLTFLFSTGAAAQTGVLGIHVLGSMVLFIASFTMGLLENTVEINDALVYIYRVLPTFAFANALSRLSIAQILKIILNLGEDGREVSNPRAYDVWDLDIAGKDMIYLGVEAVVYPILLVLLQGRFRSGLCSMSGIFKRRGRNQVQDKLETTRFLDDDVAAEATLIKDVIHSPSKATDAEAGHEEMAALLAGVRKVYPNGKVAVKDMSLGFRKNECFGLLGVNGAGKSTTQAMLSAEFPPTSGEIRIGTADVVRDPAGAQRHLGYCPQFDALFELLTGREHLSFYAKVKGIPAAQRAQVVQNKLEQFDLTKFGDKPAGGYSGGNKRKLSVAIATIGDPDFVLLDEPSAGVDPEARKFLAKAIQKLATKTSICLTTHSMEECEALCARIGIMVDGGLQCLGSAQHLKSKFGRGMQFEAMVRIPEDREVEELAAKMRGNNTINSVDKATAMQALEQIGASPAVSHNFDTSYIAAGLAASSGTVKLTTLADWYITECNFLAVLGMLAEHFDGVAQVTERQGQRVRISIPQQTRLSLGDMFDIIENNRSVVGIADFALSQTTLESIFNGMAATQSDARD